VTQEGTTSRIAVNGKETGLWLLERLVPGTGVNNMGMALQVAGRLRPDVLATSIAILVGRYDALRTVYRETDGELTKEVVATAASSVGIERFPLSGDQIDKDVAEFVGRPFELDGRLLFRAGLAAHPDGDILCIVVHHLNFDGASHGILLRNLILIYNGVAAGKPLPAPIREQVPDYAEPGPSLADLSYWREHLRGFKPDGRDLWCGSPQVPNPTLSGQSLRYALPAEARAAVQRLQRQVRAPLAPVFLAAFCALLAAHGAGPELAVGTPIDILKDDSLPDAIGYHANPVPLRVRVDFAEGFRDLARRVRDVFFAAMAHPSVSVDDLSAELPRAGASWETMIYRHMFNFFPDTPHGEMTMGGMTARLLSAESGFSRFDLQLLLVPPWEELWFRYRDEILAREDVEALMRRYVAILLEAAADPQRPLREFAGWSEQDRKTVAAASVAAETIKTASALADARPLAHARVDILAPDGRELPVGVRGELCIAGSWELLGAADGLRFREGGRDGRYCPLGELARWRPDGSVELLGPVRSQVIINGIRVSLNDVDAALLAHPNVTGAASLTLAHQGEPDYLLAFAEIGATAGDPDQLAAALREHALATLPLAAVPERVICLTTLPRDADSQVDLEALTLLARKVLGSAQADEEPDAGDPLVGELMHLWRRYLDVTVTGQTNFFAAGGQSLLAARLVRDVAELAHLPLELAEIFNYPAPAALAARLRTLGDGASLGKGASPSKGASLGGGGPLVLAGPSAFASWGTAFSCYTSALGVYLAVDDDRWWRRLADGAPYLRISPADEGLFRFEHYPRSPAGLAGLRAEGADDWAEAWAGIRGELDAAGRVIIAADAWNVPWLTSYRRRHVPHWFVLAREGDGYVVDDPLELVDLRGRQSPVRVRLDDDGVRGCSGALIDPAPHLAWREEAMLGRCPSHLGRGYRWLVRGQLAETEPSREPAVADGLLDLAERFERGSMDPASYVQADDVWQALRQRELLIRVLGVEEKLGELGGLPAREPWERVTGLWRRLPPLLAHAQLLAASGRGGSPGVLAGTLRAIAGAEDQLSASRFPLVMS
jgi:acyl-CoA synthetase (AMP-forming)/AMP-acid ligase II